MLVNPTLTKVDGNVRWYHYSVGHHGEITEMRIRREERTIEDTFDIHWGADNEPHVRWSYRSCYGNLSGRTPDLTPDLEAAILEVLEVALAKEGYLG